MDFSDAFDISEDDVGAESYDNPETVDVVDRISEEGDVDQISDIEDIDSLEVTSDVSHADELISDFDRKC